MRAPRLLATSRIQSRFYSFVTAALLSSSFMPKVATFILLPPLKKRISLCCSMYSSSAGNNGSTESTRTQPDALPFVAGSHRSARIEVPRDKCDEFDPLLFADRLKNTVALCQELGKSSVWVEVPMERCSLIEIGGMGRLGFKFHHTSSDKVWLNRWLAETDSKIPDFATHNVGVGAVVINSRDEILCVRELRKNYMPWKTPTGLSELGEQIDAAVVREVLEETGIRAKFQSILSFRQTHGLAYGRSDMFFVCQLELEEEIDHNGEPIIPKPVAQACEIESAAWIPLSEYRAMIHDTSTGHPMMRHVIDMYDAGKCIQKTTVNSVVPGRVPNAMYFPSFGDKDA